MTDISIPVKKVDANIKSSGTAMYIDDYKLKDMLYAYTVRSSISKGKIVKKTYPKLPAGYYIVDYEDIPGKNYVNMIYNKWPVFAKERVNYIGEPIALVVGEDKAIIEDIMNDIQIDYEEEEPVFELTKSAVSFDYEKNGGHKYFENKKDLIEMTYETGYQEQLYIETQGVIASIEEDKVVVRGSLQCPYYVKNALMVALDKGPEEVRVIAAVTGGAFGGKEEFPSVLACQASVAALKAGKPVKLVLERVEDVSFTTKRNPTKIVLSADVSENGEILAVKANVKLKSGAFVGLSGVVLQRAMIAVSGAYTFDILSVRGDVCETNTVPNGAFRGFGAPQMIFAVEMFINYIAKKYGKDPMAYRLSYLAKKGDRTSTSGLFRDEILMPNMVDKVMKMSDYKNKLSREDENYYYGVGLSMFLHGCGFTGDGEANHIKGVVKLRKSAEGRVKILVASTDMGQGVLTTFRKLVANIVGIPIEMVDMDNPDTDKVPDSGPTVASRTMMVVGGLVANASKKLKEIWEDGKDQEVTERYKQPEYIEWDQEKLIGDAYPAYSWGTNVVEVAVDKITYAVKVLGVWSVYDVGKAIDEKIVLGQADGGVLQGIGFGYLEAMDDIGGKVRQRNVTDYIIPTAVDAPEMKTVILENPFALGPLGAKGVGELTLIGGAPAVALAISNAIGKEVRKIPVTPEYIMELMDNE